MANNASAIVSGLRSKVLQARTSGPWPSTGQGYGGGVVDATVFDSVQVGSGFFEVDVHATYHVGGDLERRGRGREKRKKRGVVSME